MPFTTFKAFPEDLRALHMTVRHRFTVQNGHRRRGKQLTDIRAYSDADVLAKHFVADTDSNEHFVFITPRGRQTEQVFTIRGTLSEVSLPPLRGSPDYKPLDDFGTLFQYVKMQSSEFDSAFKASGQAVVNILDMLCLSVPADIARSPILDDKGRVSFLKFSTPFLTQRRRVHPDDIVDIPSKFGPANVLDRINNESSIVMSKDNLITFDSIQRLPTGKWTRSKNVLLEMFRPGAFVEAGVTFRLLKQRNNVYSIIFHLDSLTMVSDEGCKSLSHIRAKSKFQVPIAMPLKERDDEQSGEEKEYNMDIDEPGLVGTPTTVVKDEEDIISSIARL